ncbi:MAG: hypothetical protein UR13_C0007G0059 [Candidatus Woesebacteria bacterium GW2011_GWD1_31_12]|nr:MAG: hypothetical protein UR13_C0007G0059 [Candidatus Woesebacteria bacterium GW2011_GWD1_31_12]
MVFLHICAPCQSGMHSLCAGSKPAPKGYFGGSKCTCRCRHETTSDDPEIGRQRFAELCKSKELKCPKCGNFGQGGALGVEGGTRHYRWCKKPSCDGAWQWDDLSEGRDSNSLLPCPECGARPEADCVIRSFPGREPQDKNFVEARCTECGFQVVVGTSAKPVLIRYFWNLRR